MHGGGHLAPRKCLLSHMSLLQVHTGGATTLSPCCSAFMAQHGKQRSRCTLAASSACTCELPDFREIGILAADVCSWMHIVDSIKRPQCVITDGLGKSWTCSGAHNFNSANDTYIDQADTVDANLVCFSCPVLQHQRNMWGRSSVLAPQRSHGAQRS
jgi:hypothetical protein